MGYNCRTGQCDQIKKNGCPRVQRVSNPAITYQGKAMGTATANNAKRINDVRKIVAQYYDSAALSRIRVRLWGLQQPIMQNVSMTSGRLLLNITILQRDSQGTSSQMVEQVVIRRARRKVRCVMQIR